MKKESLLIILFILLIIVLIAMFMILKKDKTSEFVLDNENKYIITTDSKARTMRNDGGSNINIYYQIDFDKNEVVKCEDEYVGFKGYKYKGVIIYSKKLNNSEAEELRLLIDKIINENDAYKEGENTDILYAQYILELYGDRFINIDSKDIKENIDRLLANN